jgi:glutamyl-tRNA synthetase
MFHVGSARTTLFNWLFARHHHGVFVLRIDDTDSARSTPEAIDVILDGMDWLGLTWDEGPRAGGDVGPYFQSQRKHIYREHAQRLLEAGRAYRCYCAPDEIEARRQEMRQRGVDPKYDRRCRDLTDDERARLEREGRPTALRFAMPDGAVYAWEDAVTGRVEFRSEDLDDFVLLRSDGHPTYNLGCVVDDHLMAISHIIRGADILPNTPRQIALYQAFEWPEPVFAHVPIILGPDRSKLSKRHGAVSVLWYRDQGYLPEAMVNFLALLGWSPGEDREIMSVPELIEAFSLEGIGRSPAIFDLEKLTWMNGHYLRQCPVERLTDLAQPHLRAAGLLSGDPRYDRHAYDEYTYVQQVIGLEQGKVKTLAEIPGRVDFFFREDIEYEPEAVAKWLAAPNAAELLARLEMAVAELPEAPSAEQFESVVRGLAEQQGVNASKVIHPARVAVTGRTTGPSLFEALHVLRRDRVLARLRRAREIAEGQTHT